MQLLMQLKKKPFYNSFHFLFFGIILFILSSEYWIMYFILFIYFIFIVKKTKLIIPILAFIFLILLKITIISYKESIFFNHNQGKIIDIINEDSYILSVDRCNILIYDKNHNNKPGDIVVGDITIYDDQEKSYNFDFDNRKYLRQEGIIQRGTIKNKEFVRKSFSLKILKYNYLSYLKQKVSSDSYQYISTIVFAENIFSKDIKDSYSSLGISHILAISGFHILLLYKVLSFLLLKIFKYYNDKITIVLITIYVILIGSPISCLRSLLFLVITSLNKIGTIRYTKLDILSISGILILLINPYYLFSLSFILSFLASFIIIFSDEFIGTRNKLIYIYKLYFLINFAIIPILINMNNEINILSFIFAPILSNIIIYLILPLSYFLAVFPFLDIILKNTFIFLNNYLFNLANVITPIKIVSLNYIYTTIYYVLYIFLLVRLAKKNRIILPITFLALFFVCLFSLKSVILYDKVTFLDCGQGDSAVIELGHNKGVIVIDAYNSYDYLKTLGINTIDCLVLSHSDDDHIGDYSKILNNFDVKTIVYSKYDYKIKELLNDCKNSYPVSDSNSIFINSVEINVLGPINYYDNINSISVVLKIKIGKYVFLFTGDMTVEEEKDIIMKYNNTLKCDVLKVAHHGSNSSTSEVFLDYCRPEYSIISVGKNNKYNLPNELILERLSNKSIVYQTKDRGNINFIIYNEKISINTYR
ncbi:MAG: DNA internalization-related competence protein ComEC/Rec2 [Anaeroplasma sp.]